MRYLSCLSRFHFVGATFGPHEFIRNLKHLSYSTSVILILRKIFTCPSGKLSSEFTCPIVKSTSPRHNFLCTLPTVPLACMLIAQTRGSRTRKYGFFARTVGKMREQVPLLFSAISFLCTTLLCETKNF